MIDLNPAHSLLLAVIGFSILLMLVRPRGIPEVYWITAGTVLLLLLRLIPVQLAVKAAGESADVIFFLIGMMLLAELAKDTGVFDWISSLAVHKANGSSGRLFAWIYGIGLLTTVFLSNDATAVVLTPAILAAVRKARVDPTPHLFACALIANAASFVLPISNPANLVVFQQRMPSLGGWLISLLVPSLLAIGVTYGVLRLLFRGSLQDRVAAHNTVTALPPRGKLVLAGLACVVAVLLTASALHWSLGLPTLLAALTVTTLVCVSTRVNPLKLVRRISWGTLALVTGLYVMVEGMESIGALHVTAAALQWVETLGPARSALLTGFGLGIANSLVNNLPLGLLAGGTLQVLHIQGLLANAAVIGVDLGPNLSITGSLATILWLLALRREKLDVSFWRFLRYGAVAMPAALGAAILMQSSSARGNAVGQDHKAATTPCISQKQLAQGCGLAPSSCGAMCSNRARRIPAKSLEFAATESGRIWA